MRIVWIKWLDSNHRSGWQFRSDVEPLSVEEMSAETIGYLFEETDVSYCIVQSFNDVQVDAVMDIPKVSVLEFKELNLG